MEEKKYMNFMIGDYLAWLPSDSALITSCWILVIGVV